MKGILAGLMNFLRMKMNSLQNEKKNPTNPQSLAELGEWGLVGLPVSGFCLVGYLWFFSLEGVVLFLVFWGLLGGRFFAAWRKGFLSGGVLLLRNSYNMNG